MKNLIQLSVFILLTSINFSTAIEVCTFEKVKTAWSESGYVYKPLLKPSFTVYKMDSGRWRKIKQDKNRRSIAGNPNCYPVKLSDDKGDYKIRTCSNGHLMKFAEIYHCNQKDPKTGLLHKYCLSGWDWEINQGHSAFSTLQNGQLHISMEPVKVDKAFTVPINFDFNKANIRPDAGKILDRFASFLKENKHLQFQLASHTDQCGSAKYNKTLSQKRAKSSFEYLISRGINRKQLVSYIGEGEGKPLENRGQNRGSCKSQKNRRTEFVVKSISKDYCKGAPRLISAN